MDSLVRELFCLSTKTCPELASGIEAEFCIEDKPLAGVISFCELDLSCLKRTCSLELGFIISFWVVFFSICKLVVLSGDFLVGSSSFCSVA